MDVPVAADVLGTIGAVCWSVQLIPQIIINYRRHNATGLQPSMMMFWAWAGVPLGVYNIVSNFTIALRIQPQILAFLSLLTWAQVCYYEKQWTIPQTLAVVTPIGICMGGIEVGLIFALRHGESRGVHWPTILMAVLAALFLALGVLRHYRDVYVHRTVRGISFIFCGIDALGDLTSLLALLFHPSIDVLGIVVYGVEFILWMGIFACGGYYNFRPWLQQRLGPASSNGDVSPSSIPEVSNNANMETAGIALHDLPSSTSAFRTTSAENDIVSTRKRRSVSQSIRHRVV
ncbi:hypothetical protein AAFC00_001681 [Neodothiora populina]|uniref:PQ loop repeat protein n=1 Tax=Neodothiora populina TaxID=2781224 RepID=A0ABR3PQT6_9PEZI